MGGALGGVVGLFGLWVAGGREKSLPVIAAPTRRRLWAPPSFLKGVGCTPSLLRPCTGRNPRIRPSSSVVIVASLLEGVVWYTASGIGAWWEFFGETQRSWVVPAFVDPVVLALFSLFFLLFFSWAHLCCLPQHWSQLYWVVAILI